MMVVEAFVRSVPAADTPVQAGLRPTATEVVRGAPFSASTLADGMLLPLDGSHDTALARGLLPNSGAVVALFTAPLDPSVAEGPGAGAGAGPGGLPSANAAAAPVVRAPLDSLTHQNGGSWLGEGMAHIGVCVCVGVFARVRVRTRVYDAIRAPCMCM